MVKEGLSEQMVEERVSEQVLQMTREKGTSRHGTWQGNSVSELVPCTQQGTGKRGRPAKCMSLKALTIRNSTPCYPYCTHVGHMQRQGRPDIQMHSPSNLKPPCNHKRVSPLLQTCVAILPASLNFPPFFPIFSSPPLPIPEHLCHDGGQSWIPALHLVPRVQASIHVLADGTLKPCLSGCKENSSKHHVCCIVLHCESSCKQESMEAWSVRWGLTFRTSDLSSMHAASLGLCSLSFFLSFVQEHSEKAKVWNARNQTGPAKVSILSMPRHEEDRPGFGRGLSTLCSYSLA
eukprot:scaffold246796_cov18-Tisochrysis_lutea.AAC.1